MFVGVPGSFAVTTVGYPSVSNHVIDATAQLPAGLDEQDGMQFTVTGLPASLTFSNLNLQGFATGTLTIQGTPSGTDVGSHQVKITAQNGVGIAAQQTLMINIVGITGVAPTSGPSATAITPARSMAALRSRPARIARSTSAASPGTSR